MAAERGSRPRPPHITFPEAGPLLSENTLALPHDVAVQLQQQGLVEHRRGSFYLSPTDEVRYSLALNDDLS